MRQHGSESLECLRIPVLSGKARCGAFRSRRSGGVGECLVVAASDGERLDEFERFVDSSDEEALEWLTANVPNYQAMVAVVLEELKV